MKALDRLKEKLAVIEDLKAASSVLAWDQETYMPSGAVDARASQLATLERVIHEQFTSEELGDLLSRSEDDAKQVDDIDVSLLKVVRRDYERSTRLPTDLVAEIAQTTARAMPAWSEARTQSDFSVFRPHLERIVELSLQKAEAIGYEETPYDALLDEFEPGMRTAEVEAEFTALRKELVPIVEAIAEQEPPSTDPIRGHFPDAAQWDFGLSVIRDFGYDFDRGRQDRSAHPFTIHFASTDVRITTRVDESLFPPAFFGTLHEAGHGMYEQGVSIDLSRTPLAHGTSLGLHESQSRLWENQIGRSRPFWRRYYPDLQRAFPEKLMDVSEEDFYRAVNRVEPSLIRVEADEVTYNLHIMLRFELEQAMITGQLSVAELPAAWNDRMEAYLGVIPSNDAEGVLQDIHWSMGAIGYFPTYSLGTLMSAQIFHAAQEALPNLYADVEQAQFGALLGWLQRNIYRHGRSRTAAEILESVTGSELDSGQWLTYIKAKFGHIYGALS